MENFPLIHKLLASEPDRKSHMNDLNNYQLENDGNFDKKLSDNSVETSSGVSVYFRDIENKLLKHISEADVAFGGV